MFKLYYKNILVLLFLSITSGLFAQNVGINTTAATPSQNAILDLNTGNSNNLGLVIPNVSLSSLTTFNGPIANAFTTKDSGLMVYNTNTAIGSGAGYYYWSATSMTAGTWVAFASTGSLSTCGTTSSGYVPVFSSATCITNSTIYQTGGGLVGIGTTTAQNKLDVYGSVAIGTGANYATSATAAPTNGMIVQGQVGIGNNSPKSSAALDLTNTSNLGFLAPRMSASQIAAIASPANGLIVYNTNTDCYEFYTTGTNAGWNDIACPCTAAPVIGSITASPSSTVVCASASQTFSVAAVSGASSYTWSVSSIVGSWSGQGTNSITITSYTASGTATVSVTASNLCGSSSATSTVTVWNGLPSGTLSAPSTISTFCNEPAEIIGASNYQTITWYASTTITAAANVTAATGASSTTLTLQDGSGSASGTVYAVLTNPCGSYTTTVATVTPTVTQINIDNYNEVNATAATNTFTVSTSINNEYILIILAGGDIPDATPTCSVAIDGGGNDNIGLLNGAVPYAIGYDEEEYTNGGTTYYNDVELIDGSVPVAGTHTITVTWADMADYSIAFGATFTGSCDQSPAATAMEEGVKTFSGFGHGGSADGDGYTGTSGTGDYAAEKLTPEMAGGYVLCFISNFTKTANGTWSWASYTGSPGTYSPTMTASYTNDYTSGSTDYDFGVSGEEWPTTTAVYPEGIDTQAAYSDNNLPPLMYVVEIAP